MTGFATVPTHNPGDTIPSADWNVIANDLNSGGVMRMLADTTLGVSAASIDFTSIPQTFAHLMLVVYSRTDDVAALVALGARFNGDAGANYDQELLSGQGATVSAAEIFASTSAQAGVPAAASAGANLFGVSRIVIPHYTNALNNKIFEATMGVKTGTTTGSILTRSIAGAWRSNAAISRVTLIDTSGGNFVSGTRATLYGLPL